jgi:hypothetical protein
VIATRDIDYTLDRTALLQLETGELIALLASTGAEIISASRPHRTHTFRVVIAHARGKSEGVGPCLLSAIVEAVLATEAAGGLEIQARGAA